MMLMMDKKKALTHILGPREGEQQEKKELSEIEALAEEIIGALDSKDPVALANSLKAFFYTCDSMPHEEYKEE